MHNTTTIKFGFRMILRNYPDLIQYYPSERWADTIGLGLDKSRILQGRAVIRIIFSNVANVYYAWAKRTSERYKQHEKI